jgi:hypothetical protein
MRTRTRATRDAVGEAPTRARGLRPIKPCHAGWLIGAVVTAASLAACSSAKSSKSANTSTTLATSGKESAEQFARDYTTLPAPTYAATYALLSGPSNARTVAVVQDGNNFKVSEIKGGTDTEVFDLHGTLTSCSNGSGTWTCRRVADEASLPSGTVLSPARTLSAFGRDFANADVTLSSQVVAGQKLRCATANAATRPVRKTLCLTPKGVIGSATTSGPSGTTLTLMKLATSVAPGQFLLPAKVGG